MEIMADQLTKKPTDEHKGLFIGKLRIQLEPSGPKEWSSKALDQNIMDFRVLSVAKKDVLMPC